MSNIYTIICPKCNYNLEIESDFELNYIDYIIQETHISNVYDSFSKYINDTKIDIEILNNKKCDESDYIIYN